MAKIKKRGQSGAAKNYITRNQAIKKLQVSLADFRRLCILKGIFPRQPRNIKKANKGSTAPTSFYYAKDIAYLQHEPILQGLRDHKSFAKKLSRAVGRREWSLAKSLDENKPVYRLDHIIKQRYPTFDDSLKDLDDALSLLTLFANLPSNPAIKSETIQTCARLCAQWQLYVMKARVLSKVFLSIKGIYFQAEVRGQTVTWLVPYMFTQHIPNDVDFKIMSTFLELYQTLLGFVLFKLYSDINLVYPPHFDEAQDEQGAGVGALRLTEASKAAMDGLSGEEQGGAKGRQQDRGDGVAKKVSAREVRNQIKAINESNGSQESDEGTEESEEVEAATMQQNDEPSAEDFVERPTKSGETSAQLTTLADLDATSSKSVQNTLFKPYYFYISRECPRGVLEFVIRSFGASAAQMGWDEVLGSGSAFDENDARITHHIVDRPTLNKNHQGKRAYVQPQWIIDCVNTKKILSSGPYEPGKTLPPHLSPFVDDKAVKERGGYVPTEAKDYAEINEMSREIDTEDEDEGEDEDEELEEESEDKQQQADVESIQQASRPALSALLAAPLNEDLLASAELEAESKEGEDGLVDLRKAHEAASNLAKKASKRERATGSAQKGDEEEAKNMAKMLMSNRQRKLYNQLNYSEGKRGEDKARLEQKKRKLEKEKGRKGQKTSHT